MTGTAEANSTVTVYVDGSSAGSTTADAGGSWSFTPGSALTETSHTVKATATDAAGNTSVDSNTNTFTVDTLPPPAPIVQTPANGSSTNDATPTMTGTAEANSTVTVYVDGSSAGSTTADTGGSWSFTPGSALTETSHTVKATATDAAGNTSVSSNTNTFTIDTTAPTVTINQAVSQADPTSSSPISLTVIFSEPVTGFATGDATLSGSAGATTGTITGGPTTYNVAVSGMTGAGTVIASLAAGVAQDAAGNSTVASTSTDNSVLYDTTAPTVTSIVRADANPTNAANVRYTVTFSKNVSGVDAGDFSFTTSGVTGAAISGITSSGTTVTVTVDTGTGDGILRLNLLDDDTIVDTLGNLLGGNGAGNGNYTGGELYAIDRTGPEAGNLIADDVTSSSATYSFTVVFSDNLILFTPSLDASDIRVTGPGGFDQLAALVDATPSTNGTPRTATYQISAPGGSWDADDNGTYTLALEANQVRDIAGNFVAANTLGTFNVNVSVECYTVYLPMLMQSGTPTLAVRPGTGPNKRSFTVG